MKTEALLAHLPAQSRKALLKNYQFAMTDTMRQAFSQSEQGIGAQFIPDVRELNILPQELSDPIADDPFSPLPFLVHRYHNRVLWKIAPTCAVYCRFCFRKEHIGRKGEHPQTADIQAALAYIAAHPQIEEVILSGGDPMTLSAPRLAAFLLPLHEIGHVQRIRLHTRVPVVAPDDVREDYLQVLRDSGKQLAFVIHVNHAAEFTAAADAVIARLQHEALLLSQSVLLKGVNDSVEILKSLTDALLVRRIRPYYLHHLDMARGTSHFRLSLDEGIALYQDLRALVSGIALPNYVVELPNGGGKTPVLQLNEAQRAALAAMGIV